MNYEIDPEYKVINRMIDCNGVDDIKANNKAYVIYKEIDYEKTSEWKRQEED